jgi:hypothetical protein
LKALQYLGVAIGCTVCFLAAYGINSSKPNIDLTKVDKATGIVTVAAVITHTPEGSRSFPLKVFMFQLNNVNEVLGTYRPEEDYTKLVANIKVGDIITVYYDKNKPDNNLNSEVYQIEKNGQVLQDYDSFAHNNLMPLVLLFIVAGLVILLFGPLVIELKKYANKPAAL